MELLYPVRGRPLLRHGAGVFAMTTGHQVGVIHRGRIYSPAGRYLGTLDEDCIVDRIVDSLDDHTRRIAPFTPAVILLPETLDELADTLAVH